MAENLQGLLDKIQTRGLEKANAERDAILKSANEEAAAIVAGAKQEAEAILRNARTEAANLNSRAESAVKQAARDIILKLDGELKRRITNAVRENAAAALNPALMSAIIAEMAGNFAKNGGKVTELELLLAPQTLATLGESLRASLRESFSADPELFADADMTGGLKISINGSEVFFDFSDEAITDLVGGYIGSRLASVIGAKAE